MCAVYVCLRTYVYVTAGIEGGGREGRMRGKNEFIFLKVEVRVWWLTAVSMNVRVRPESQGSLSFLLVGEEEPGNQSPGFQSHIVVEFGGDSGRNGHRSSLPLLQGSPFRERDGEVGGEPCAVGRGRGVTAGRTCFPGWT